MVGNPESSYDKEREVGMTALKRPHRGPQLPQFGRTTRCRIPLENQLAETSQGAGPEESLRLLGRRRTR